MTEQKTDAEIEKPKATPKPAPKAAPISKPKSAISKLAIFATLLAILALAGNGGLFYWQEQQRAALQQSLLSQNQQQLQARQVETKQLLANQQALFDQQLANIQKELTAENQETIDALSGTVQRLSQRQPSDWLIQESEYLIRVAGRTLWLEHDLNATKGLLKEANNRLKTLNDPKFLPVREAIHKDMESLALMPELETEEVILKLMGLAEQVEQLPLALAYVPESEQVEEDFELSEDPADWRENLAKSWQKFKEGFITIRRRTSKVEPLLTPQQQQNLTANLYLKLQQTQWSASNELGELYQKNLTDIQSWLESYYDMDEQSVIRFHESIQGLKSQIVSFADPSELSSLAAIRAIISSTQAQDWVPVSTPQQSDVEAVKPVASEEIVEPAVKAPIDNKDDVKPKLPPAPTQSDVEDNAEDNGELI